MSKVFWSNVWSWLRSWLAWANPYVTLIFACALSIVLVGVVSLLMAFMQYQARLISSLANMTGGQLVEIVDAEKVSRETLPNLDKYRKEIDKTTSEINNYILQSNFKIEVICSIFKNYQIEEGSKKVTMCVDFLQSLPFDGTLIVQFSSQRQPTEVTGESPARDSRSGGDVESKIIGEIAQNFVKLLENDPKTVDVDNLMPLVREELIQIAKLNKKLRIELLAKYQINIQEYNFYCRKFNDLRDLIPYRRQSGACQLAEPAIFAMRPSLTQLGGVGTTPAGRKADAASPSGSEQPISGNSSERPQDERTLSAELTSVAPSGQPGAPRRDPDITPADQQRSFELVSNYMFYNALNTYIANSDNYLVASLLLSPSDYLALFLVSLCGALGGYVNILFLNHTMGKDPTFKQLFIDPVQGTVCALIAYILLRSGFIAVADAERFKDTSTISPFFLAFVGIAAGLLANKAIESFRARAASWLGGIDEQRSDKWGVGLADASAKQQTNSDNLAKAIGVPPETVDDWLQEKEPVPVRYQRDFAVALATPERKLFTSAAPPAH